MTTPEPLSPCCNAGILNYYKNVHEGRVISAKYRCRECKSDVPDPTPQAE